MKLKLNIKYLTAFAILFTMEVLIAIFLKGGFIRHTFGDFLVVMMLYCLIKAFIAIDNVKLALFVLVFAYVIEFLQLADLLNFLDMKGNRLATLILGSHFSIGDLIAYTLGVISSVFIDEKTSNDT